MSNTKSQLTFSSMGEDFIEARFDPQYRNLFEAEIEEFDAQKLEAQEKGIPLIPTVFHGSFEKKAQRAIQVLVQQVQNFASQFSLTLSTHQPEIHFFTPQEWTKFTGKPLSKNIALPASKTQLKDQQTILRIILPSEISSSEIVINTIRLVCSKLFGKLFFDETVPHRIPYKNQTETDKSIYTLKEKVSFCHLMNQFSPNEQKQLQSIALSKGFKKTQPLLDLGKKEVFHNLSNQGEKSTHIEFLEKNFERHYYQSQTSLPDFLNSLAENLFSTFAQTTFLLPHEEKSFLFLKEQQNWTLFHALEERAKVLEGAFDEILECQQILENITDEDYLDSATAEVWQAQFAERLKSFKQNGWVKLFLIEDVKLTPKQQSELVQFPLWVWSHILSANTSQVEKPERFVKQIQQKYKNSVYQKIFEACFRLQLSIREIHQGSGITFQKTKNYKRLKTLLSWFNFQKESYQILVHTTHLATLMANNQSQENLKEKETLLQNFEQGWSYFISFALIHLYYLHVGKKQDQKNQKAPQYYAIISKFVKKRVYIPSFQLVEIFKFVYQQNGYDLAPLISTLLEECPILDFFLKNQQALLEPKEEELQEALHEHGQNLHRWLHERKKNQVTSTDFQNAKKELNSTTDKESLMAAEMEMEKEKNEQKKKKE